jgi:hypothetical protein
MSRGPGRVECSVLDMVTADASYARRRREVPTWHWLEHLACVFSPDPDNETFRPSRYQVESTRRAVHRLRGRGLIETGLKTCITTTNRPMAWSKRTYRDDTEPVDVARMLLVARVVITDIEREQERLEARAAWATRFPMVDMSYWCPDVTRLSVGPSAGLSTASRLTEALS